MNAHQHLRAVMQLQAALAPTNPGLLIDGRFGPFTAKAYDGASKEVHTMIDRILGTLGTSVSQVRAEASTQRATAQSGQAALGPTWLAEDKVHAMIRRELLRQGVPEHFDAMRFTLEREATRAKRDGMVFFDSASRSPKGGALGLFQFQPAAWDSASRYADGLGSYSENVLDPVKNIAAAVGFMRHNIAGLKKRGRQLTPSNLYLAHNQGLGFFDTGRATALAAQSKEVQGMIKEAQAWV